MQSQISNLQATTGNSSDRTASEPKNRLHENESETLWYRAYGQVDELLRASPPSLHKFLFPYYHYLALSRHQNLIATSLSPKKLPAHQHPNPNSQDSPAPQRASLRRERRHRSVRARVNSKLSDLMSTPAAWLHAHMELSKLRQVSSGRDILILTVDDPGSGINLKPAIEIARKLKQQSVLFLVVTSELGTLKELRRQQIPCVKTLPTAKDWAVLPIISWQRWHSIKALCSTAPLSLPRILQMTLAQMAAISTIKLISSKLNIAGVLSINETSPLAISTGEFLKSKGKPWCGFFPVLLGKRADCRFFPAEFHFAYGEQLIDLATRTGAQRESFFSVGSPTYDVAHSDKCKSAAQHWNSSFRENSRIVVASEGFTDPETELLPVLATLQQIQNCSVILKLHPADSSEYFAEMLQTNLGPKHNVLILQDCDLGELLQSADLLICIVSNIIINAAILKTPTLVCDFSNKSHSIDFVKEGLAFGCYSPDEIQSSVESLMFYKRNHSDDLEIKFRESLKRFNGPNDGQSAARIVAKICQITGIEVSP